MNDRSAAELPVVVVGAGFSGTLLMVNLLRQGGRVVLVERSRTMLARGLSFGTSQPELLLNVRAANMSAFPDDAGHFLRWMNFDTADKANRFVPRLAYGRYLRELLMSAIAATPDWVLIKEQEAVGIDWAEGPPTVRLDSGETVAARAVVLAVGNFPPSPFELCADLPKPIYYPDPWHTEATESLGSIDHVLLLGTGLTAVDIALSLDSAGFRGRITALSRRGLKPRAHAASGPAVSPIPRPEARGSRLLRLIRVRSLHAGWRAAIDELRPHTQSLWRLHDEAAQSRFLRHLRPWWDVHRHRLAPQVAERAGELEAAGRLSFLAGKLTGVHVRGDGARISYRKRGTDDIAALNVGRIINCTGPAGDITRTTQPIIRDLLDQGRIRPDAHRLGIDVDQIGRVRDAAGRSQDKLFAVGPITKGEAWEIFAVPDIRRHVWHLARYLTASHWVGGEGL